MVDELPGCVSNLWVSVLSSRDRGGALQALQRHLRKALKKEHDEETGCQNAEQGTECFSHVFLGSYWVQADENIPFSTKRSRGCGEVWEG